MTITGTEFIAGSTVKFGTTPATSVTINSSTSITAVSPTNAGTVDVSVTNSGGTSAAVPADQFTYLWLGLTSNSGGSGWGSGRDIDDFTSHNIVYDRGIPFEMAAGELPSPAHEESWSEAIEAGMTPIIPIEFSTYNGKCPQPEPSRYLPTGAAATTYVEGFVKTATAIRELFPNETILFEPINEPWCAAKFEGSNAAQYAEIVAELLPEAEEAGIPLSTIYVGATGKGCDAQNNCTANSWIPSMYAAEPSLKTLVKGWYFHPYGPPTGTFFHDKGGIEAVPKVRTAMTSGQNNIIISEIGFCTPDVGSCSSEQNYPNVPNSTQAAADMDRILATGRAYYEAGWLKALLVYSRHSNGWAMQAEGGAFTAPGKVLNAHGDIAAVAPNTSPAAADEALGDEKPLGPNGARREVVYHGVDHAIWLRYYDGSAYWHNERLGGEVTAGTSPTVVRERFDKWRQWIFYRGADNAIHQWEWSGSAWSNSTPGGSPRADSSPTAVRDPSSGKRWVYFVNTSGTVSQLEWTGSVWTSTTIGSSAVRAGTNLSPVINYGNGNRRIYYVNTSGELSQAVWNGSSWSNGVIGGTVEAGTSPSAVAETEGESPIWVYFTDTSGILRETKWNGSTWTQTSLGKSVRPGSSPSAAPGFAVARWVFYVGSNGKMGWVGSSGTFGASNIEVRAGSNPGVLYGFVPSIYPTKGNGRRDYYVDTMGVLHGDGDPADEYFDNTNGAKWEPKAESPPTLSSSEPRVGVSLSATTGTWSGEPVYAMQWRRCEVGGGGCVAIAAATASTYTPTEADLGHPLVVTVTAQNDVGSATASSAASAPVTPAAETIEYSSSFGTSGTGNGQFNQPSDAAVDSSGNVWVVDRTNHRLQKFNAKGEYVSKFGSKGTGNGQFEKPVGVAIDSSGNLWVADSGNGRIQKFNSAGEYVSKFGSKGAGNGQFSTWGPKGIAIDASNNIWVSDYSGRIQKFNSSGEFQKAVGTSGTGNGQFQESAGIDIGPEGKIWVSDWVANRVQVFNSAGEYLSKFGSAGSGNGQFSHPDAIEVDGKGNVWIGDEGNSRVQQFNQSGEYVAKFGSNGSGAGQFKFAYPFGITSDDTGNLWIPDVNNHRVQRWVMPKYVPIYSSSFGTSGTGNGQFNQPSDAAVDSSGNVWVVDRTNHRLQKFNAKGEYVSKFGSKGTGNGQFEKPVGVAIDSSGNLWVADSGNGRIQKFNSAGEYVSKFGSKGAGNGQFSTWGPKGIAIDASNNIWVSDYSGRIQKFNSSGEFQKAVGTSGTGNGQFQESAGIDIGPEGKIWVSDWVANRVQVFNSAGEYLSKFGSAGSGNGQFSHPDAIEVDGKGNVWIGDEGNSRVQQFNQSGEYVAKFGSNGSGAGQFKFAYPFGITSDDTGNLWIPDVNNHRVQRWKY